MQEKETAYAYWLANIYGIGAVTAEKLLAEFKSAESIYHADQYELEHMAGKELSENILKARKNWDIWGKYEQMKKGQIQFLPCWHEEFPERLQKIPAKPVGIYVKGNLPSKERKTVAIVGARNCSQYGTFIAKEFAGELAKAGVEIISGMARGIDSISQRAALDAGGASYAVFGCGVDVCYPRTCYKLYQDLLRQGGVVSSYPPETLPKAELFPPRNRIISGLSDVVLVVEASLKSGTMITVDMALEQGRDVYVIPGRLTDRTSDGCNRLIKQGAGVVLSPEDLLKELEINLFAGKEKGKVEELTKQEEKIWKLLDFSPKSLEQICLEAEGTSMQEVMESLIQLCLKECVLCPDGSHYVRKDGELLK